MLDSLESMILAQETMCLKKYIEDYASPWKCFLSYDLEKAKRRFSLQCHFDCRNLLISMPGFYDCLDAQSTLTRKEMYSHEVMMKQLAWNNK